MFTSTLELQAVARTADLESIVSALEIRLAALGEALKRNDSRALETTAQELQRALALAVSEISRASRQGGVSLALRRRLALATGQVAAQREALARATAALDRAMEVLLPSDGGPSYGAHGGAVTQRLGGSVLA